MDVLYLLRESREHDHDVLRYSLRSLSNVKHDRVFVGGGKPDWIQNITHIPVAQGKHPWHNQGKILTAALESDLSEEFLFMNCDFFIMKPQKEMILYSRTKGLGEYADSLSTARGIFYHNEFVRGIRAQRDALVDMGFDVSKYNTDMHAPMPVNKTRLRETLEICDQYNIPRGHWRAIYGRGLRAKRIKDPKIMRQNVQIPREADFVSVSARSWQGIAGKELRNIFSEKSRYELDT